MSPDAFPPRPLVGFAIAAFNAERYLAETLASLRAQTYESWCCAVVDDGSTDGTAAVAEAAAAGDGRVRLVRQPNGGVGAARNAAFAALPAETEFVSFLDADDLLVPDATQNLVNALMARPDAIGCSGWAEYMDGDGRPTDQGQHRAVQTGRRRYRGLKIETVPLSDDTTFSSIAIMNTLWPSATVIVRADVFRRLGGFDPATPPQEDVDFLLRATRQGPFAFVDHQVAWYRRHGGNFTKDKLNYMRCSALVRRKAWLDPANRAGHRVALLRSSWRALAWMARRQLDLVPRELGEREWMAAVCGLGWMFYAGAQLALITPRPPWLRALSKLVSMEDRYRAGVGRPGYLVTF